MIDPGSSFYVVTLGRRYVRDYIADSTWVIVTQQIVDCTAD